MIVPKLERQVNTARNGTQGRIGGVVRSTRTAEYDAGVETLAGGEDGKVVTREIDADAAQADLVRPLLGKGIAYRHIVDRKVVGAYEEARRIFLVRIVGRVQARDIRVGVLGRPGLEGVLVEVHTQVIAVVHQFVVGVVVEFATELVSELCRDIHAVEAQRSSEAAAHLGQRAALAGLAGVVVNIRGRIIAVVGVYVPERLTGVGIDTRIGLQVGVVHRAAHLADRHRVNQSRLGHVAVEREDLVLVVRHIEIQIPREILIAQQPGGQLDLDTGVAHRTHVDRLPRVTQRRRYGFVVEHVRGLAREILDATAQAVVPKAELDTHVERVRGLPRNVLITLVVERQREIAVDTAYRILILVGIVVAVTAGIEQVVVTLDTIRSLQFQHVEPLHILQEVLLGQQPCTTHGTSFLPPCFSSLKMLLL